MAIDGVDHRRAHRALALISSDSGARKVFLAAYSGQEDALVLLSRAATEEPPGLPEELGELHRRAFGRTHTRAEEHAARTALAALTAAHSRQAADSDAVHAAIIKVEEWATRQASAEASSSAGLSPSQGAKTSIGQAVEPRRYMLRTLILAILVVGSIAIAALVVTRL